MARPFRNPLALAATTVMLLAWGSVVNGTPTTGTLRTARWLADFNTGLVDSTCSSPASWDFTYPVNYGIEWLTTNFSETNCRDMHETLRAGGPAWYQRTICFHSEGQLYVRMLEYSDRYCAGTINVNVTVPVGQGFGAANCEDVGYPQAIHKKAAWSCIPDAEPKDISDPTDPPLAASSASSQGDGSYAAASSADSNLGFASSPATVPPMASSLGNAGNQISGPVSSDAVVTPTPSAPVTGLESSSSADSGNTEMINGAPFAPFVPAAPFRPRFGTIRNVYWNSSNPDGETCEANPSFETLTKVNFGKEHLDNVSNVACVKTTTPLVPGKHWMQRLVCFVEKNVTYVRALGYGSLYGNGGDPTCSGPMKWNTTRRVGNLGEANCAVSGTGKEAGWSCTEGWVDTHSPSVLSSSSDASATAPAVNQPPAPGATSSRPAGANAVSTSSSSGLFPPTTMESSGSGILSAALAMPLAIVLALV